MSAAQSVLVAYGVVVLTYGFLLGIPLAAARAKAPAASRHLVTTHLSGLIQGGVALALAFTIGLVEFDSTWATVAAALVVFGLLAEIAGGTVNWLMQTQDQFAERSPGFRLNSLSGIALPGVVIIAAATLLRL